MYPRVLPPLLLTTALLLSVFSANLVVSRTGARSFQLLKGKPQYLGGGEPPHISSSGSAGREESSSMVKPPHTIRVRTRSDTPAAAAEWKEVRFSGETINLINHEAEDDEPEEDDGGFFGDPLYPTSSSYNYDDDDEDAYEKETEEKEGEASATPPRRPSGRRNPPINEKLMMQSRPTLTCMLPREEQKKSSSSSSYYYSYPKGGDQALWDLVEATAGDLLPPPPSQENEAGGGGGRRAAAGKGNTRADDSRQRSLADDSLMTQVKLDLVAELESRPKCNVGYPSNKHAHLSVCIGESVVATLSDRSGVKAGEAQVTLGRFPSGFSTLHNLQYDEERGQLMYVIPDGDICLSGPPTTTTIEKATTISTPITQYKTIVYFYCEPESSKQSGAQWNTHFFNDKSEDKFGLSGPTVSGRRKKKNDPTCSLYVTLATKSVCSLTGSKRREGQGGSYAAGDDVVPIVCH